MKITKEEFDYLYDENILKKEYDKIIVKIDLRFQEICNKVLKKDKTRGWFDYDTGTYDGESPGWFDPRSYIDYINIIGEYIDFPQYLLEEYDETIPTRWLWEDFEEELKQLKKEYDLRQKEKKEKQKQKRNKKLILKKVLKTS